MKVLITGTHFTPAVATIEELKKIEGVQIVYVGRKTTLEGDETTSIESKVLPELGVKFISLIAGRIQRSFTFYTIPSLLKIPFGFIQALYVVLKEKPDVILSFGGYVSVPIVFAGWLFSIPIIIHEQTLVSGLANKISSCFADKICLSFNQNINEKVIVTGNPLRKEILNPIKLPEEYRSIFEYSNKEKLPTILVMGGNQGSHLINKTIESALDEIVKKAVVIHVSGDNKFGDLQRLKSLQKNNYLVKKWIGEEIGAVLQKVDLVVSRAGANTLYELAFFGKPTLVIPIPYLYQDEQNKNAQFFESFGMVKILPQSKLNKSNLIENILTMLKDLDNLKNKAKAVKEIPVADAAKRLALETMILAKA